MQTLSKKRKVEHTFASDDDDEDWGNEITAEEFDIIQSQIVDTATTPMVATSVVLMQSALNKDSDENQLIEKGEIHMLRQKLEQKSKELEMERQQKCLQIQKNLEEHQKEQKKLTARIESLESSLNFKNHDIKTEQLKIKKPKSKANQPLQTTRVSTTLVPSQFSNNFTHTPNLLHNSTQTEPVINSQDRKTALLKHRHAYSNCKYSSSNILKTNSCNRTNMNLGGEVPSLRHQVFTKPFISNEKLSVNQTYTESIPMLRLHPTCYCSDTSPLSNCYSNKEFIMFQNYVRHLKEYSKSFFANVEQGDCNSTNKTSRLVTSDVASKYDLLTQSQIISSYLSSAYIICQSSPFLCRVLIKSLQECSDVRESLSVIASCARPLSCNREVINKNMVNWAFRVLQVISSHCSSCCSNLFLSLMNNIRIYDTLTVSCTVETAFCALQFLEQCSGIKALFSHQNDLCIFECMGKLLKLCLHRSNSVLQNMEIVVVCSNLLACIIVLHGVATVYNSLCTCIAEVLKQILKWICNQNVYKENILIPVFHLLQILYKQLETEKWFDLRSRMSYNYILTLDKVCHNEPFHIPALKDIAMELWEQEVISCPQMIR